MIRTRKSIFTFWLLALFVTYQVSIGMLAHVHYINGVMIVHSHLFHGKHSHDSSSTVLIDRLAAFNSTELGAAFSLIPERRVIYVLRLLRDSSLLPAIHWSATALRAPPVAA